jgi:metal-responsive CopG/Arc/MetJ family transcriptional regulator
VKTIAITIDTETLDAVDQLVRRRRSGAPTNRSRIVRDAVRRYLAGLEREADEQRERAILKRHARRTARQAAALIKAQARP